jgi:hypothetical protein
MRFFPWIAQRMMRRQLETLAAQIAAGAFDAAYARVAPNALAMVPAEARGYVRARSRRAVRMELAARSLRGRLVPAQYESLLAERSLDQLVDRIHDRLRRSRTIRSVARRAA